ncbi:MAG: FAD-dependent 5-carboxymethylaminomethyl-2-thiouridine(34) oxidoreductase MnmC, partial [Pseudomonadota bacterium]
FERSGPGAGASGNVAGLIMPRLDLGDTAPARFFLQAYLHTLSLIERLKTTTDERLFTPTGVLLKTVTQEDAEKSAQLVAAGLLPFDYIETHADGVLYPQAGVIAPRAYVSALMGDTECCTEPVLEILTRTDTAIIRTPARSIAFDAAVIANGGDALSFLQARSLPLAGVAGQIDYFPDAEAPETAVAAGPYAAPAPGGGLVIGATYDALERGAAPEPSQSATLQNIKAAASLEQSVSALDPERSQPRASVRCQTPDRLPVVGSLPDWGFFSGAYDDLRQGKRGPYPPAQYAPRLHILSALGSRGLVTAPLCAELIASALAGAPSPVDRRVREALHPARFFIRDLKRSTPPKR